MTDDLTRWRTIRVLALLCGACSLAVVVLSAYLRLDAAGLGCVDWPACYGSLLANPVPPMSYGVPRLMHRIVASLDLVLACLLVWRCTRPYPMRPVAHRAVLLLVLILALAVLGFFSADPRRALIGFLNIVGGLVLVVFSWRVVVAATPGFLGADQVQPVESAQSVSSYVLGVGILALMLTVALGAWIGATYSAVTCLSVPACNGVWWPQAEGWSVFDPLVTLASARPPGDAGGIGLHLLHRGFALLACLCLGTFALFRLRHDSARRTAIPVLLLLILAVGLGGAAVSSGLDLWLVVGHGLAAALLLAAAGGMMRRQGFVPWLR